MFLKNFSRLIFGLLIINIKGVVCTIIYEKNTNLPIVAMQLVFAVAGSMKDDKNIGLARFSAQILGEGTKSLGSSEFSEKLEARAISLHANSGTETFNIELASLKEEFDFGVEMLTSLLKEANLTEEAMEKVRLMTLGYLSNKESDFDYIAGKTLKEILHVNQPVGHPNSGTVESIKSLKISDVENFLSTHLDIANAIIVIGGDISDDEIKEYAKRVLNALHVGTKRELPFYDT